MAERTDSCNTKLWFVFSPSGQHGLGNKNNNTSVVTNTFECLYRNIDPLTLTIQPLCHPLPARQVQVTDIPSSLPEGKAGT